VVQKASFRSPEFIGFFAPISKIRAGPLATGNGPARTPRAPLFADASFGVANPLASDTMQGIQS